MLRLIAALVCCSLLALAGCGAENTGKTVKPNKELVLYSELEPEFTQDLIAEYNKQEEKDSGKEGGKVLLRAVYELKPGAPQPDIVLAERRTLNGLKLDGMLKPAAFAAGDSLPQKFYDGGRLWYGAFYDPAVLLVNQQYAREIGQENIRNWSDLENLSGCRLVMENLSDSNSTRNFLAGMADKMGETISLNYFWNLHNNVIQYTKFPFTSVRMTAVGDADVALTRQSYVFKYLDNKFPAYVVHPAEGAPVNPYGLGLFRGCANDGAAVDFIRWVMFSEAVQRVSQKNSTGFMFLFPRGEEAGPVNPQLLWLNDSYLTAAGQDALVKKWLDKVRFSK